MAAGSTLGLGLGRLRIRLDGPQARTTTREVDVISGQLVGGAPERVVVQTGDAVTEPRLDGRAFTASVSLKPGLNHIRVVATDAQGAEVEETVTVQYQVPINLAITSPTDGHRLTADDPPLVVVNGQVDDPSVSTLWLFANDRRFTVPVASGRFRAIVPVLEPTVRVRVQTPSMDGRIPASAAVTVHGAAAPQALALLLADWPRELAARVEISGWWRQHPGRLDGGVQMLTLKNDEGEASPDFFYLRNPKPGVYTFVLTYRASSARSVSPLLYLPNGTGAARALKPVALNGSGYVVLARVLMPQGVLWEQDDWFTGRSASGDTITKFRFPEGITWTERLGDLGR